MSAPPPGQSPGVNWTRGRGCRLSWTRRTGPVAAAARGASPSVRGPVARVPLRRRLPLAKTPVGERVSEGEPPRPRSPDPHVSGFDRHPLPGDRIRPESRLGDRTEMSPGGGPGGAAPGRGRRRRRATGLPFRGPGLGVTAQGPGPDRRTADPSSSPAGGPRSGASDPADPDLSRLPEEAGGAWLGRRAGSPPESL